PITGTSCSGRERDGELAAFLQKFTITHVRNWQEHRRQVGTGHVYQGRYKSFPVETDEYFFQVVRYVERNALRANLVDRAEDWRWSSLWRRVYGTESQRSLLSRWPLPQPGSVRRITSSFSLPSPYPLPTGEEFEDEVILRTLPGKWTDVVNRPQTETEVEAIRRSVVRGSPYGSSQWSEVTAKALGLQSTLRSRGRPRKQPLL
ncbi:MAG TPA: hypothetical protein VHK27_06845, partial [Gammaproteobacteria bacterium]|nr:hypothetical protein [Gammaproteobacteria bacterium]